MSKENQVYLTGKELLDKLNELSHLSVIEIAEECGYFTITDSGQKKVNCNTDLRDFYEAVAAAREGISISEWRLEEELYFTRPWVTRKGIDVHTDRKTNIVLVRVPLDKLSATLADLAEEWQRDVIGKIVTFSDFSSLAFQIVGQKWSIATPFDLDLALLSNNLQQPIIEIWFSDESFKIIYSLYESGELIESFAGYEGIENIDYSSKERKTQRFELSPYPNNPEMKETVYFWSKRRRITAAEIGNIFDFVERFLKDYEAYDPGIDERYFLAENYRIENPGFTTIIGRSREIKIVPEFVRVDYFVFPTPQLKFKWS